VDREDGSRVWENVEIARTLPSKYLGMIGVQQSLATTTESSSSGGADPLSVLDMVTAAKVKKAAVDATTYEKFIDAMLGLTTAVGTPIMDMVEIGTAVASSDWYEALHRS
jgi:hypothetical protein